MPQMLTELNKCEPCFKLDLVIVMEQLIVVAVATYFAVVWKHLQSSEPFWEVNKILLEGISNFDTKTIQQFLIQKFWEDKSFSSSQKMGLKNQIPQ